MDDYKLQELQRIVETLENGAGVVVIRQGRYIAYLEELASVVQADAFKSSLAPGSAAGLRSWVETTLAGTQLPATITVLPNSNIHFWLQKLLRVMYQEPLPLTQYGQTP